MQGYERSVSAVTFGSIGSHPIIATGSWDQSIRLWDARTGKSIGVSLDGHSAVVTSVALGELDHRMVVVSGSEDGTVRAWDAMTGVLIFAVNFAMPIYSVAIGTDFQIAAGGSRGIVVVESDMLVFQ
jgi:WD40 repeat protein